MRRLFCLLACWFTAGSAFATHILGGYIQARRVVQGSVSYEFTITLLMDDDGGTAAGQQQNEVGICFGDGSALVQVPRLDRRAMDRTTSLNTFRIQYTYSAPAVRTVSVLISNRSDGTRNLPTSAVTTPYYLETTLNTGIVNSTPGFVIPENLFQVATGVPAVLALRSADAEGDSIVYAVTRARRGDCGAASELLPGYRFPHDVAQKGTFKVDALRGELTWNAPTEQGRYVFVVRAEEFRSGQKISEAYLDMTLTVTDRTGTTPTLIPPYEAATESTAVVTGLTGEVSDGEVSVLAYPVPVQDQLLVRLRSTQPVTARMQVFNAQGQLVREVELAAPAAEHEVPFDATNWAAGAYLIRTFTMGKAYTNKVMKQ
ncbi:T9SS type A sorting domain-containing protein [Tellurirhabdus rosea]|uniref:T9SS type A sorting domain-containing protein n=1 Tax=Tellurirhabdus rosea TaxID=2674997 RepID=UPI00224DCC40|nr:T9SS type A sorting domain-containing protein [Tellurirhabdus rosea]